METNNAAKNLTLVKSLRALYRESRIGTSFEGQKRTWKKIEKACSRQSINTDIIIMEEEAFNEFSIPVIEYIINSKQE